MKIMLRKLTRLKETLSEIDQETDRLQYSTVLLFGGDFNE